MGMNELEKVFIPYSMIEEGMNMAYFPFFIELKDMPCLVVGGGEVAIRKVKELVEFEAKVTVVAKEIAKELVEMEEIRCFEKEFQVTDLEGMRVVVAATNDAECNQRISEACRQRHILVNAVDQKEDCEFIFPAYCKKGNVVAAFSTGGQSPVVAQYVKEKNETIVTEELGQITEVLGNLRDEVKLRIPTVEKRKQVYREILQLALEQDAIPTENEIQQMIEKQEEQ